MDFRPGLAILFFIFLTLKLCGVIGWSWWIVTLPVTAPIFISSVFFLVFPGIKK